MDWVFFSKLLPQLIYPFSVVLYLLLAAVVVLQFRLLKMASRILWLALGVILVCGSPLGTELFLQHEQQYLPVTIELTPKADAIVVLGGTIRLPIEPRVGSEIAGNRLLHAFRLYKANKAKLIIVSGGNVFPQQRVKSEAHYTAEVLQEWGVRGEDILVEGESRNTHDNAIATKKLMESRQIDKILLVTSGFHMPRALATFRTAGIDAIPTPSSYSIVNYSRPPILNWIPSLGNLGKMQAVIREKLGILVYRYRDWIS